MQSVQASASAQQPAGPRDEAMEEVPGEQAPSSEAPTASGSKEGKGVDPAVASIHATIRSMYRYHMVFMSCQSNPRLVVCGSSRCCLTFSPSRNRRGLNAGC